eukprot:5001993-Amphidinium_carterae.1
MLARGTLSDYESFSDLAEARAGSTQESQRQRKKMQKSKTWQAPEWFEGLVQQAPGARLEHKLLGALAIHPTLYATKREGVLQSTCDGEHGLTRGRQQQLGRVVRGLHPNCRAPVAWT